MSEDSTERRANSPYDRIRITRTHDADVVNRVICDQGIYDLVREDDSPQPDEIDYSDLIANEADYFLLAEVDGVTAGVVIFDQDAIARRVTFESHLNILPSFTGQGLSACIGYRALRWMAENTEVEIFTATIPDHPMCDPVFRVARKLGFQEYARRSQSYLRDGRRHDDRMLMLPQSEIINPEA